MNFSQLHERLRIELLRRIEREVLTATLLAQKTGLQQPHISNFLRGKRRLSIPAVDRVLAALGMSAADLLPAPPASRSTRNQPVPLVTPEAAMFDDAIRFDSASGYIYPLPNTLPTLRAAHGARRPARERFVAVKLDALQASTMEPILQAESVVILDRHSNIPINTAPLSRNIFALPFEGSLQFFYLSLEQGFLVLRPHSLYYPVHLVPVPLNIAPSDLITGRVCHVQFPL